MLLLVSKCIDPKVSLCTLTCFILFPGELPLYLTAEIEVQIDCIWRLNKCDSYINIYIGKDKNIVGKGENAGYQHFLLFQQCFQKAFKVFSQGYQNY